MSYATGVSTRTLWHQREIRYWLHHPHRCVGCGRAVDPHAFGGPNRCAVHHLSYEWAVGSEPDEVLAGLCLKCHRSLHHWQQVVSRAHGWMHGLEVIDPARHYRHLWSYSIRWIRFYRFWCRLIPGRVLPPWDGPARHWRNP